MEMCLPRGRQFKKLAQCQVTSHDLAKCQVTLPELGSVPSQMTNLATCQVSHVTWGQKLDCPQLHMVFTTIDQLQVSRLYPSHSVGPFSLTMGYMLTLF